MRALGSSASVVLSGQSKKRRRQVMASAAVQGCLLGQARRLRNGRHFCARARVAGSLATQGPVGGGKLLGGSMHNH